MRFLIDDIDYTNFVERGTIEVDHQLGDTIPMAKFSLQDTGSQFFFTAWNRVAIIDETAYTSPTHNILINPTFANTGKGWTSTIPQGTITYNSTAGTATLAVNTTNTFTALILQQTTRTAFVQPNQRYTLSFYYAISGLNANAQCTFQYTTYGFDGQPRVTSSVLFTANVGTTQYSVDIDTGNARYIKCEFDLQRTNTGTATGTYVITHPQLEMHTFGAVSYPTPDCVAGQPNCTVLGDGTVVRQKRIFGGFITHLQRDYPDSSSNRFWDIEASGAGILLAKIFCNANYSNATDQFVLQDLVATYAPGDLSTNNVIGTSGIVFDQIAWQDVPLKDAFSSIAKSSNYLLWVDPYFDVHYQAEGYSEAPYDLSDNPDMVTSFPYYAYQVVDDGTEMAQRIKVYGGSDSQTVQPALVETFSGNGSNKVFNLANIARSVQNVAVAGTNKKVGIAGKDSASNYDVLINKTSQTMTFTVAPASGTNNVSITYTYKNPSAIRAVDANSIAVYGFTFDGKIEDTTLVTQADIYQRGITALHEYSTPRTTITLFTDVYFSIGDTVGFSSVSDLYSATPFTIQKAHLVVLGTDSFGNLVTQYQLEPGPYRPSFVHHLLHIHKQVKHKSSHVATLADERIFNIEHLGYAEAISTTSGGGVVTYGTDTFVRANTTASTIITSGWGAASDTEAWAVSTGGGTFQIVSNEGKLILASASVVSLVRLGSTSHNDMTALVRVKVSSSAFTNAGIALRITASNTAYRIRLNSNDATQGFGIFKTVAGTSSMVTAINMSITPATAYWIRAYVSGTTIQGRIWVDGASEPTSWTITTTDSSITGAGGFGLTATCINTTDNVQFDSFTVTAP